MRLSWSLLLYIALICPNRMGLWRGCTTLRPLALKWNSPWGGHPFVRGICHWMSLGSDRIPFDNRTRGWLDLCRGNPGAKPRQEQFWTLLRSLSYIMGSKNPKYLYHRTGQAQCDRQILLNTTTVSESVITLGITMLRLLQPLCSGPIHLVLGQPDGLWLH